MNNNKPPFTMNVRFEESDAPPAKPWKSLMPHWMLGVAVGLLIALAVIRLGAAGFFGGRPETSGQKRGYPWTTEGESPASPPPREKSGPLPTHEQLPDGRIVPARPVTSAGPLPK